MSDRSDCVETDAAARIDGYGWVYWSKRQGGDGTKWLAHRLAWFQNHGPIPDGMFVCHACDNPACVNVKHLFLGTNRQNVDDMMAKGRNTSGKTWADRLTEADVQDIRNRYQAGSVLQRELAAEYGITRRQATRIINRQCWATV